MLNLFSKKTYPDNVLIAPCEGTPYPIEDVNDSVFSEKMMGDGIAIRLPAKKMTISAIANGTLTALFPTGHAFGIALNNGIEVLVHIGINTVEANGVGFKVLKKENDNVKAGDPIVEVDVPALNENYDTSLIIVITETSEKNVAWESLDGSSIEAKTIIAKISD